jgi:hypothetical protein
MGGVARVPVNALRRWVDALWSSVDPDEPVFCDCLPAQVCPDCS